MNEARFKPLGRKTDDDFLSSQEAWLMRRYLVLSVYAADCCGQEGLQKPDIAATLFQHRVADQVPV